MVMETTMSLVEVIGLSLGWVFAIIFGIFHILIWKFTHAWTFLRAWFQKVPIVRELNGGWSKFVKAKGEDQSTIDMKDGFLIKSQNSHLLDWKSKVPIYDRYGDYAFTIDPAYNPIIHELRESGFKITNIDEYKQLIRLAIDGQYQETFLSGIEDQTALEDARKKIRTLQDMVIRIQPYKTYKLQDLSTMFPNNINTVSNDHKVISLVDRNARRQKLNAQLIIYAAMGCLIFVFAIVAVSKFVKDPTCPDVVCNCARAGIEMIQNATAAISANTPNTAGGGAWDILVP